MKLLRFAVLCLLLGFVFSHQLSAQTQITTGVIQGTVSDPSGAVVVGATVGVNNPDTNFTRTLQTDVNGRFVFLALSLNLVLKVSAVPEQIVVTATPTIDATSTENSSTLAPITVSSTPVLG